jgi:hypothetical protein
MAACSGSPANKGEEFLNGVLYVVGEDIDAGEYVVLADEYSTIEDSTICVLHGDPREAENEKLPFDGLYDYSESFHYNDYVSITEGQYVYLKNAHFEPIETEIDDDIADVLKVGKDIPAGFYDFSGTREIYIRDGYDSELPLSSMEDKTDVYLADGEYIHCYDNDYEYKGLN